MQDSVKIVPISKIDMGFKLRRFREKLARSVGRKKISQELFAEMFGAPSYELGDSELPSTLLYSIWQKGNSVDAFFAEDAITEEGAKKAKELLEESVTARLEDMNEEEHGRVMTNLKEVAAHDKAGKDKPRRSKTQRSKVTAIIDLVFIYSTMITILRRAKLRSIDGQNEPKPQQNQEDILCRLSEKIIPQNYLSGNFGRHEDCPSISDMSKRKLHDVPASPVNNFPEYGGDYDGGMTDSVTLEIFSLRRRNAELIAKVEGLNNKLTRVHEVLTSLKRFCHLWIFEGQGETYGQIQDRMRRIELTITLIEDRMVGPAAPLEIPERWRQK